MPLSKSQIDKLSQRLRRNDVVSDDDLDLLLEVLRVYQQAGQEVRERLGGLGLESTMRTKTTSVLVDKLKRDRTSLKSVHDIAGARIVQDCDRDQQDEIVQAIVAAFTDGDKPPLVKDRRATPSHGYRAVHVIVTVHGLPVEIQVRTLLQDMWAQLVEALGDRWGRGIRYGEAPPNPDHPTLGRTRQDVWRIIQGLSDNIDETESVRVSLNNLEQVMEERRARGVLTESEVDENLAQEDDVEALKERRDEVEQTQKDTLKTLRDWALRSAE